MSRESATAAKALHDCFEVVKCNVTFSLVVRLLHHREHIVEAARSATRILAEELLDLRLHSKKPFLVVEEFDWCPAFCNCRLHDGAEAFDFAKSFGISQGRACVSSHASEVGGDRPLIGLVLLAQLCSLSLCSYVGLVIWYLLTLKNITELVGIDAAVFLDIQKLEDAGQFSLTRPSLGSPQDLFELSKLKAGVLAAFESEPRPHICSLLSNLRSE